MWLKYHPILKGRVLDVGADECYLGNYLSKSEDGEYWGIGLGGSPDQQVNLEKEKVPFPDGSFDCVLCLDVLEHLDNIHEVFDELCRVTRRYVIISLPNPWASFYNMLRFGAYRPGQPMKFYGLPPEPPVDRHKWFFSNEEARRFITDRAAKNGLRVVQMDNYETGIEARFGVRFMRAVAKIVRLWWSHVNVEALLAGTLWAVLEKGQS
jgi:SAM-dependent methyltransferase